MDYPELPEPIDFEWDSGNQTKSLVKHEITTTEAEETFFNFKQVLPDYSHSTKIEPRFVMYGQTNAGKILFISLTIRRKRVRIISARPASKMERETYEKFKKTA
jgi:uncharacterized protein